MKTRQNGLARIRIMSLPPVSRALAVILLAVICFGTRAVQIDGRVAPSIKVGVYLDLSGQTSSFGQSTKNGIEMARDEINNAGGINGRKIELVIEDEQGEPDRVAAAVEKLIKEDKVHALLGEVASMNSLSAAPIAQKAQVPMISPASTNPDVTQIGDYIFRVCFIDPFQGEALAIFATGTLKAKRAAILFDSNSTYSKWLTDAFREKYTRLGGRVVSQQSYTQNDRYFTAQLKAIRRARPDVLFVPGYYSQAGVIAVQARRMGLTLPLLGGDGWDAPQLWVLGGKAMNNSYMSNHFSTGNPSPVVQKFIANYKKKYQNSEPDALVALGYDAMMLLADAIRRARTTEGPKLRDAIAQTRNFAGVTGSITLNNERNAVKPAIILQLLDGKFIYRETVYSDSLGNR